MDINGISKFPPGPENPDAISLPPREHGDGSLAKSATAAVEKIKSCVDGALAKATSILPKRGRGRPSNAEKAAAIQAALAPNQDESFESPAAAVPAPVVPMVSPALLTKCVGGIVKGLCAFPAAKLEGLALRKGKSPTAAAAHVKECVPTDEEISAISEFAGILLQKYNVDTQWAPEVAGGALLLGVAARFGASFASLNRLPDMEEKPE